VSDDRREPVEDLGAEATKLLQALQDWVKDSGSDYAGAAASAATGAASAAHRINEHIATGSAECRYCPLCQVISAVRGTPPEAREHLVSAATSFVHAVAALLATPVPDQRADKADSRDAPVQKINVSDDEWEDD